MGKCAVLPLLAVLLLAPMLCADVVVLKSGRRIEGKVVQEGETVVIRVGTIKTSFPQSQVKEVIRKTPPREELAERRERLDPKDAGAHYELGLWCLDKKLPVRAEALFRDCMRIDPNHAAARKYLGFVQRDGKWVTLCRHCRGKGKADCERCGGRGQEKITCPKCDNGRVPCTTCRARGYFTCKTCDGRGTLRCNACNGRGRVYCGYNDWGNIYYAKCKACSGRGVVDCPQCIAGKIDCKHCKNGRSRCPACDGRGHTYERCAACEGERQVRCRFCNGTGIASTASTAKAPAKAPPRRPPRPAGPAVSPPKPKAVEAAADRVSVQTAETPAPKNDAEPLRKRGAGNIEFFGIRGVSETRGNRSRVSLTEMVFVPSGSVPVRLVHGNVTDTMRVAGFFIDRTEVSNKQYAAFLRYVQVHGDRDVAHPDQPPGKDHTPKHWSDSRYNQAEKPVVGVDWFDAYAFARWTAKRLPTREEWQLAAGVGHTYPRGDEPDRHSCNHGCIRREDAGNSRMTVDGSDGFDSTSPVKAFPRDASPAGCFDMAGNASEWTATQRGDMACRCGGNICQPIENCRGNMHWFVERDLRSFTLGFRCARNAAEQ